MTEQNTNEQCKTQDGTSQHLIDFGWWWLTQYSFNLSKVDDTSHSHRWLFIPALSQFCNGLTWCDALLSTSSWMLLTVQQNPTGVTVVIKPKFNPLTILCADQGRILSFLTSWGRPSLHREGPALWTGRASWSREKARHWRDTAASASTPAFLPTGCWWLGQSGQKLGWNSYTKDFCIDIGTDNEALTHPKSKKEIHRANEVPPSRPPRSPRAPSSWGIPRVEVASLLVN